MKLLFADLHANKRAAKEIEKLAPCFEEILFAGDICGFGKDFKYCIDMFIGNNIKAVLGNHDVLVLSDDKMTSYLSNVSGPIVWTRKRLSGKYRDYMENLPESLESGDIFVIHTTNFEDYIHTKKDCKDLLEMTDKKIMVIGHTHMSMNIKVGNRRVINPGGITKGRKGRSRGYAVLDDNNVRFVELEAL